MGALVVILVFWLTSGHPAVAFVAKFGLETEACFAPMAAFIPIRNPADAVADDACSPAGGSLGNRPIRIDFGSKFLPAQNLRYRFDYSTLNVDGKIGSHKNFSPDFDVLATDSPTLKQRIDAPILVTSSPSWTFRVTSTA